MIWTGNCWMSAAAAATAAVAVAKHNRSHGALAIVVFGFSVNVQNSRQCCWSRTACLPACPSRTTTARRWKEGNKFKPFRIRCARHESRKLEFKRARGEPPQILHKKHGAACICAEHDDGANVSRLSQTSIPANEPPTGRTSTYVARIACQA